MWSIEEVDWVFIVLRDWEACYKTSSQKLADKYVLWMKQKEENAMNDFDWIRDLIDLWLI